MKKALKNLAKIVMLNMLKGVFQEMLDNGTTERSKEDTQHTNPFDYLPKDQQHDAMEAVRFFNNIIFETRFHKRQVVHITDKGEEVIVHAFVRRKKH